jgi:hypothetical protein
VLLPLVRQLFPKARAVVLESYDQLPSRPEIDAAVWSLDQARAWRPAMPALPPWARAVWARR